MRSKEIIIKYLLGTFSSTYITWGIILILNDYGYLKVGSVGFWLLYPIGGLASTFFGAYLYKKSRKENSYKKLLISTFNIKQNIRYYALVLTLCIVSFGIPALFGISEYKIPWYLGLMLIFQMIFFGGLEEVGWRNLFQPTLEKHISFELASVITGCLWAIWHLPLFFMDGMNKGMNFGVFIIGVLGMSFMLGAIYRVSNSLWLCVLFHAIINAFSQVWVFEESMLSIFIATSVKIILSIAIVALNNRNSHVQTV